MKWNLWLLAFSFIGIVESLHNNESHRILSRRKRWLIFPEGSSLQVVHFQGIPIYGVPLVFILGITGAIGYELPYYPLSDIAEELGERIKNGTLGLRHDQDIYKVKYVDKPYNKYTNHKYYYTDPAVSKVKAPKAPYKWKSNFYLPQFNTSLLTHLAKQPAVVDLKNLWTNLKDKFQDFSKKNSNSHPTYSNKLQSYSRPQAMSWRRNGMRHRNNHFKLLPILAKRSIENHQFNGTSFNEKFKLEPSLSRHKLYSRIETYLER